MSAALLSALMLAAPLGACARKMAPTSQAADATPPSGEEDYRPEPELSKAARQPGGRLELIGNADARSAVRLSSVAGAAQFTRADAHGEWRLSIAASPMPRLFGLAMSDKGRVVQAMGYLFVAPDGTVARLRAGGGSQIVATTASVAALPALDYDNQFASVVSGRAAPGQTVSLAVDGVQRGQAAAGVSGRFVLPLNQPLTAGPHEFDLATAGGETRLAADVDAPAKLGRALFAASRTPAGWRVDWVTPGGGEQTTLVFLRAEPAA
ncbi:MAG: hypothetical protein ACREEW_13130 [Caulobacteraceae bacterium]